MTFGHFQSQMTRLSRTFGKFAFPEERASLLWREVQWFDDSWFTYVIDGVIGNCRHAPLLSDFSEAISKERERNWEEKKKRSDLEAKEFMQASFPEEDRRWIIQQILKRIGGGMEDSDFSSFLKTLKKTGEAIDPPLLCGNCEDTGLLWGRHKRRGGSFVFKCPCRHGEEDRRNYPYWSKIFEAEYTLDIYETTATRLLEVDNGTNA